MCELFRYGRPHSPPSSHTRYDDHPSRWSQMATFFTSTYHTPSHRCCREQHRNSPSLGLTLPGFDSGPHGCKQGLRSQTSPWTASKPTHTPSQLCCLEQRRSSPSPSSALPGPHGPRAPASTWVASGPSLRAGDERVLRMFRIKTSCMGDTSGPEANKEPPGPGPPVITLSAMEGVNWFCYVVLGLIFVTDFTPLGTLIKMTSAGSPDSSVIAAGWLAGLQWAGFVLPTLWYINDRGLDLKETLRLKPAGPVWIGGAALAGASLWTAVAAALALKSGILLGDLTGSTALDQTVLGSVVGQPDSVGQWAQLLLLTAFSPAVAEELMFRGFLLSAMLQRFGWLDAIFVTGALFSAGHLDPEQFFGLAVMGFAAGGAAIKSDSILPAIALHCGYNAAALLAGAVLATA